ncbi:MAG: peptidoglycan editing factor PgeF [Planctomycetes bacterium]|nr:peptidoglycan editing factor PgeF [Planctomycetota bacterium]
MNHTIAPNIRNPASSHPGFMLSSALCTCQVPHAFTTRGGGVSSGIFSSLNFGNPGDLPVDHRDPITNIKANQAAVAQAINAADRRIVEVHQVHGAAVHVLRAHQPDHSTPTDTKADALVTDDPSRLIAVRVADCTPVLLSSADGRVVAAVHAGWRGVIAGVLPAAIRAMRAIGATNIHAAIGPCISSQHFEVGPEVAEEFFKCFGKDTDFVAPHLTSPGKSFVDLKASLASQATAMGLVMIDTLPHCTVASPELFFSHRRDAGRTGRMMAIIGPRAVA